MLRKHGSMKIKLSDAGKRFNREWIFKNVNLELTPGECYAITGPNGSGKSTLLQVLCGNMALSEGSIEWWDNSDKMEPEKVYSRIALSAPYLEVIEEMTAAEFLQFHSRFKPLLHGQQVDHILQHVGLESAKDKQIRYYSSGMKQRMRLAQAFFTDTPLLLLDEPCTNLDSAGVDLYHRLIKDFTAGKTIVVCSNDEVEYSFCKNLVRITDYK